MPKAAPSPLDAYAQNLLAELCDQHPIGYHPKLEWRNLRVTAGLAYYREGRIVLSKSVLTSEERVALTLKHEYAHLMAVSRYGQKAAGHGAAWKHAMQELGLPAVVRHNYEVERNEKRQEVVYRCVHCGITFSRHKRLARKRKWFHAGCGGALRLESVKRITVG